MVDSLGEKPFEDPDFPPTVDSLIKEANRTNKTKLDQGVGWTRASELEELAGEDVKLYKDGIEPADIQQGSLADCYFLSSLAAISEYPNRIKKLFA